MYESTQAQKDKYLGMINDPLKELSSMIDKVNKALTEYGANFYKHSKGIITDAYYREQRTKVKEELIKITYETYGKMFNTYVNLKESYLKESFPLTETTDQIELNFISKELELMDREELETFYLDNCFDKNKIRLFNIEVKRREKSSDNSLRTDAAWLKTFEENFAIDDIVTRKYDERIKYMRAAKSAANGTFCVVTGVDARGNIEQKIAGYSEVMKYVEARSSFSVPQKIDIMEVFKYC